MCGNSKLRHSSFYSCIWAKILRWPKSQRLGTANRYLNLGAEESKYATNSNYPVALVKMITCDHSPNRSPRIRHLSELTERDWENAVQGQGNIKRRVFVAIISLRASSPSWAREASRARRRKGAAKLQGAEEKWRSGNQSWLITGLAGLI